MTEPGVRWICFVENVEGYCAYLCLDSGRVHLFAHRGRNGVDAADDCGYLCISDLSSVIKSLVELKEQIEVIQCR